MDVLDDYLVNPEISVLEKTRIQAQVLVPVLRAMRAEFGKAKADALVKEALQAADDANGPSCKAASMTSPSRKSTSRCCGATARRCTLM